MSHLNARLTPKARPGLVREVGAGWTQAEAARRFRVSRATATKCVRRYRDEGEAGLRDRCSRPRRSPGVTAPSEAEAVLGLRRGRGWGPHRIAWALGMAPSTAYAVLRRAGLHRRDRMHRVSRDAVRYERGRPGELRPASPGPAAARRARRRRHRLRARRRGRPLPVRLRRGAAGRARRHHRGWGARGRAGAQQARCCRTSAASPPRLPALVLHSPDQAAATGRRRRTQRPRARVPEAGPRDLP